MLQPGLERRLPRKLSAVEKFGLEGFLAVLSEACEIVV